MAASMQRPVTGRAHQRPDAPGFVFNGTKYDDFADHPDFPADVRTQVARWAVMARRATPEQQVLANLRTVADGEPDELLQLLERESRLLDDKRFSKALSHLSQRERARLLRPQAVLRKDLVWPLTIREASLVLADVSENQLRDWDNAGVCRAARWGKGRYRGYFRSHLVLATLIRKLLVRGYRLDRVREVLGIQARPAEVDDLVAVATAVADECALAS